MKRILILVCFLINSVAFTQCLNTSSVTITPTVNGGTATWPAVVNAQTYSIAIFTHPGNVFSGVQTVTSSTTWTFTGLNANTLYRFQIATICIGGGTSTGFSQNFTTQTGVVAYTPMTAAGYSYKYLKVDSMLHVSAGDTSLLRSDKRGGAIVFKNSDSTFYGWNGLKWETLGGGLINATPYIDTIFLNGDTLKYKKNNVTYGITNVGNFDTTAMSNRIDSKLPISDTLLMLAAYKHWQYNYTNKTYVDSALATKAAFFTASAPLFRSGALLGINNANSTTTGALTTTDWNTFNNKVGTSTTISTTAPLQGGGDLSTNRTLSIDSANGSRNGAISRHDWNKFNNSIIFPNYSKVRIYTAIVRVYVDTTTNGVVWTLLDDADHDPVGVSSISVPNSSSLRINFSTPFKTVFTSIVSMDETLQLRGVQAGASLGLNFADINFSVPYQGRSAYNYNGTTWGVAISGSPSIASITQSGNNIVINNPLSIYGVSSNASYANLPVHYAGTNNRILRYVTSGLGFNQTIVQLVDPTTGSVVAPNASDRLVIFSPQIMNPLSTQTNNNATSIERYSFGAVPNVANIWCTFIGEVN